MASVTFKNVTKYFQSQVPAVRDINLKIKHGEFFIIVGPSGCGKTTLLRMLAGLESASQGDIYINDTLVNSLPPGLRNVSMVFQNYALFPHMTVFQNIAFGLRVRRLPRRRIDERVKEAASLLGLASSLRKKPAELSGGQRQRAALGRAIVRDPDVFLFDEPLSNLDARLRGEMRVELLKLHERLGSTVLYVTHDQVEAMTLGDTICVLNKGAIQQVGAPHHVYHYPANTFVASFFGSPPMNLFQGLLKEAEGEAFVELEGGTGVSLKGGSHEASQIKKRLGGAVYIGMRPGSLGQEPFPDQAGSLTIKVEAVELIGEEKYIHGKTASGQPATVSVAAGNQAAVGNEETFHVSSKSVHLFDSAGNRI